MEPIQNSETVNIIGQFVANNAVFAPILIWFMQQYIKLVNSMIDTQKTVAASMQRMADVIQKCEKGEK